MDLTGLKFGRLKVVKFHHKNNYRVKYYKCMCDCGQEVIVQGGSLTSGHTKSCGCLVSDNSKKNLLRGNIRITHNLTNTRLYRVWKGMKQRCNNSKRKAFKYYGGRGIKVCDEWSNDFKAFYDWSMCNGYSDNLTIDRINNDRGYEPSNCRWITNEDNVKNMWANK